MKKTNALVLVALAGCACSAAFADDASPAPQAVITGLRVGGHVGQGGRDAVQDIYNNGDGTATTGYFSGANTTHVIDDIYFNRGAGAGPGPGTTGVARLMTSATIGIASTATVNPNATVDVAFTWYNTFTTGTGTVTPVATNPAGNVRVTVQAPIGGWQANTVYLVDLNLSTLPGGGITTVNEYGGAELALYADASNAPSIDFNVGWYGNGVTVGNSTQTFWFDNNADGIIAQSEAFIWTGAERPRGNIVLSLQSDVVSGSCCLPDGSCILANSQSCARVLGVYGGDGSACGSCTQPGACVLPSGSCILASSGQCGTLQGVYKGSGTDCATAVCRSGSGQIVLWDNGPLGTGNTIGTTTAPAGTQYSEASGTTTCQNTTAGYSSGVVSPSSFRLGDDFVVPTGETWTVQDIDFFAYQTGSSTTTSPFNGLSVAIWNGVPYDATSTIVGGDESTSVLTGNTFANIYRVFNNQPGTTRPVFKLTGHFSSPVVLPPGHYWLSWQTLATNGAAHFSPPVTTKTFRGTAGRNAIQKVTATDWQHIDETSAAPTVDCGTGFEGADFPFVIKGTTQGNHCTQQCYANCDGSTIAPILNVNDFICFQTKYAQGDSYANCDNSTIPPVLNVNDFICFQTKYAQGCP